MAELLLLMGGGVAAGAFGALLGLGGGVLIVPLLTLGFGLPLREAVGASLVCVIVTSSAAASVYLQRDVANLRLGMTLEMFTAIAALAGGLVAFMLPDRVLAVMFAALLLYVAVTMVRARDARDARDAAGASNDVGPGADEHPERLPAGTEPAGDGSLAASLSGPGYRVRNLGRGVVGSLLAGIVSALFGIGGGIVKVPVMNLIMGVPMRVATATSNLMIGVTASSGALIYLFRGGIDPYVAGPTAVGVFAGASLASRWADRIDLRVLRLLFVAVLIVTAAQMALRGLG
ncbi:MAG: sulfite exporter TauE/SafE family protein [Candidatus Limnocylindrales bacterium]